jgi:hypothetical protein
MTHAVGSRLHPNERSHRHLALVTFVAGLGVAAIVGWTGVSAAGAATQCNPDGDICVVVPDTVQTPLGVLTVTATATNVVTAHLDPISPNTLVIGIPFAYPPGPPVIPGYARTSIATTGGLVNVDTITIPPGPHGRISLPNLAIVSIHPPSPCRAHTTGTTVVFTPIYPPGPPS